MVGEVNRSRVLEGSREREEWSVIQRDDSSERLGFDILRAREIEGN